MRKMGSVPITPLHAALLGAQAEAGALEPVARGKRNAPRAARAVHEAALRVLADRGAVRGEAPGPGVGLVFRPEGIENALAAGARHDLEGRLHRGSLGDTENSHH